MEYEEKKTDLDQYDWGMGEVIDTQRDRYAPLIGQFLIDFSILENNLNIALAEAIHGRTHELGYVIVEKLSMSNKIDLFNKLYLRMVHLQSAEGKAALKLVKQRLEDINTFRNIIAHANWATMDQEKFVRTKVRIDKDEGSVSFKNIKVTTPIIRAQTREISRLTNSLDNFSEKAREWRYEKKSTKAIKAVVRDDERGSGALL